MPTRILPAVGDADAVRSLTTLLSQLPDAEPVAPVVDSTQLIDTLARLAAESVDELPEVVNASLPVDPACKSISGHSMGGHGAIIIGVGNPDSYRSVSAFAPIASASQAAWGQHALTAYLGTNRERWRDYDAAAVIRAKPSRHELLVDQGMADPYLDQLRPDALEEACRASGQVCAGRRHYAVKCAGLRRAGCRAGLTARRGPRVSACGRSGRARTYIG